MMINTMADEKAVSALRWRQAYSIGVAILAMSACFIPTIDPGCACDADHGCRRGEECIMGFCVGLEGACSVRVPAAGGGSAMGGGSSAGGGVSGGGRTGGGTSGGSTGGGRADAGLSTDVDGGVDPGPCRTTGTMPWAQCRDGFAQLFNGTTSGSNVVLTSSKVLVASQGQGATPDFSGPVGIETPDAGRLRRSLSEGTLQGLFRIDVSPSGTATLLALRDGQKSFVDMYVSSGSGDLRLGLFCGENVLLSQRDSAGGAVPLSNDDNPRPIVEGVTYEVVVRWRFNSFCSIDIDPRAGQAPLSVKRPNAGAVPLTDEPSLSDLRIGIVDYDVVSNNAPFRVTYANWRLSLDAGRP